MPAIWLLWFGLAIATFAGIETWALKTGRKTLSRCVWDLGTKFPLFWIVLGIVVGALATHFAWHWCPA
jgi:hypothetical protein